EPLCVVPDLNMWLQRKVAGTPLTEYLNRTGDDSMFGRVAEAAGKIHRCGVEPPRRHAMVDELNILQKRFDELAVARPDLSARLRRLMEQCREIAADVEPPILRPIHRDFYADQILISGDRMYLLDWDLCCLGDPALDIGNFIAH